jgi:hypothetical protein
MDTIAEMVRTNPGPLPYERVSLTNCIRACVECAQACTACADACMGEGEIEPLRRCIRLALDCAAICDTTSALLSRHQEPDIEVLRGQVDLCALACRKCADECDRHAATHEHCRVCSSVCLRCEEACQLLEQPALESAEVRH